MPAFRPISEISPEVRYGTLCLVFVLMPKSLRRRCDARLPVREVARDRAIRGGSSQNTYGATDAKIGLCADRSVAACTVASRRVRKLLKGRRGRSQPWSRVAAGCSEQLKAEGKPVPWGRKRGGVNRSAAERQFARASQEHARARRDLKAFLAQRFRRQRRQAREVVKGEVERLLAEHEEERRRLRLPALSPEQREAVIDGFRKRVVVPSDDGSMPWSDIQVCRIGCASLMIP